MNALIVEILERDFPENLRLRRAWQLSGGATRQTWAFEADGIAGAVNELRAVVQVADSEDPLFGVSRRAELSVLREAAKAGVPTVPILSGGELADGSHYLVTAFVDGESRGSRIVRSADLAEARALLPGQVAAALSRIHRIDEGGDWLELPRPGDWPALTELDRYEEQFRSSAANPHPVLELALRWLRRDPPAPAPARLVHGDFRVGNFLVGNGGLLAVLDWELCHWGDPLEDLGWLMVRAWRFGSKQPVGGLCTVDEFLSLYSEAGGADVDRKALHWWEVFGNFRWAVLTIKQASLHLSGHERSVELASLGRLTAETEWELLELIASEG
jgi:aminoglycoside phosphotransferase (APT) family kinase protein